MNEIISGILGNPLILAVLIPMASFLSHIVIDGWRKRRAFKRLSGERLMGVGVICREIRDSSGGAPLIGRCVVTSMAVGRVEVRAIGRDGDPDLSCMSWTGRELESLNPVVEVEGDFPGTPRRMAI